MYNCLSKFCVNEILCFENDDDSPTKPNRNNIKQIRLNNTVKPIKTPQQIKTTQEIKTLKSPKTTQTSLVTIQCKTDKQ